jgi:hypothetical protein
MKGGQADTRTGRQLVIQIKTKTLGRHLDRKTVGYMKKDKAIKTDGKGKYLNKNV